MTPEEAKQAAHRLRGVSKYLAQESEFLSGKAVERGIQRTPIQTMRAAHLLDEVILALDKYVPKAEAEEREAIRAREQMEANAQAAQARLDLYQGPGQPWDQGGTA